MTQGSTLRDLTPNQTLATFDLQTSNSFKPGSYFLKLRKPDRNPVFSRAYQPGDPTKLIDWKAFARNDQLLIREKQEISSGRILIAVDNSATMLWPNDETNNSLPRPMPSKFEVAIRMAFNLGFIHLSQGDQPVLALVDTASKGKIQGRKFYAQSVADLNAVFAELHDNQFDLARLPKLPSYSYETGTSWKVVYFISDGLNMQPEDLIPQTDEKFLIHLLSSLEERIDWANDDFCYYDYQIGKKEFIGSYLKERDYYLGRIKEWRAALRDKVMKGGGNYIFCTDETPISVYHRTLLNCLKR
jgi:hypothetical protein